MGYYSDVFCYIRTEAPLADLIDAFHRKHPHLADHCPAPDTPSSNELVYQDTYTRWYSSRLDDDDASMGEEWLDQFWQWCEAEHGHDTSGCFLRLGEDDGDQESCYWGDDDLYDAAHLTRRIDISPALQTLLGQSRPGAAAGLPLMDAVVDLLNDRDFTDQPLNPDPDTLTDWYDRIVGPALDRIEDEIVADAEPHGILPDELHPDRATQPAGKD